MKLSKRFRIIIFVFVVLIIVSAITSTLGFLVIRNHFTTFYETKYQMSKMQMEIRKDVQTINKRILWVVMTDDATIAKEQKINFDERYAKINSYMDFIFAYIEDNEMQDTLENALNRLEFETYHILDMLEHEDHSYVAEYVRTDFNDVSEVIADTLESLGNKVEMDATEAYEKSLMVGFSISILLILISVISLIIALILGDKLTRSVLLPLKEIEQATKEISEGNLAFNINYESPDEIGMVATRLRNSIKDLRYYISDIDYIMGEMTNHNFDIKFSKDYTGDFRSIQISLREFADIMSDNLKQIETQQRTIHFQAYHDPLTQLPNRRQFNNTLSELINSQQTCTLLFLDIDNFKSINDTKGHIFGDKVLCTVANTLDSLTNDFVDVFRFGGDEFIILTTTHIEDDFISSLVNKINRLTKDNRIIENDLVTIEYSIGVAKYPKDATNLEQLLMYADMALYTVKANGKNDFQFFNAEMDQNIKRQMTIRKHLTKAINNNLFQLVYQPQVNLQTGKTTSYEALLRLKDNIYGPDEFIKVAEDSGQILAIGRWVAKAIVDQLSIWKASNVAVKPVAINFSGVQLKDLSFLKDLDLLLQSASIEKKYIEIEVTESILMIDNEESQYFFEEASRIGFTVTIDDFGAGHSSLTYMTYMPISKIKLDKSLCDEYLNAKDKDIVKNLISLCHSFDLITVAEGIESIDAVNYLKGMGCDLVQGYYFSKPMAPENITKNELSNHSYALKNN